MKNRQVAGPNFDNALHVQDIDLLELSRMVMKTTMVVSMPILLLISAIGLVISVLQSLTQIQEQSLSFLPKLLAGVGTLFLLAPWMAARLAGLMLTLWNGAFS